MNKLFIYLFIYFFIWTKLTKHIAYGQPKMKKEKKKFT